MAVANHAIQGLRQPSWDTTAPTGASWQKEPETSAGCGLAGWGVFVLRGPGQEVGSEAQHPTSPPSPKSLAPSHLGTHLIEPKASPRSLGNANGPASAHSVHAQAPNTSNTQEQTC